MALITDSPLVVPMAAGTAALWLLVGSGLKAEDLDFSARFSHALAPIHLQQSPYMVGSAGTPTEAYGDWSVKLDEPGNEFVALVTDFIARQKPLPPDIAQIVARRFWDLLE